MYVEYSSNNSGGSWWLTDEDWYALERAGWEVEWRKDMDFPRVDSDGRWLGTLATDAKRTGVSLRVAIDEWEDATGKKSSALGCSCCGVPHSFTAYDDDENYLESYSPSFPDYGDDY